MPERDLRAHWNAIYETKAPDQVSWYQPRPETSLGLIQRTGKGLDAHIIDVGGGASCLIDALLDAGFRNLTVLDLSEEALAKAKRRLGARASIVEWVAADIRTWVPKLCFDVWHDRALFHFLTEEDQRAAYRSALGSGVAHGGQVIIGTFAPDGPERCSGLLVRRYDANALAAELGREYRLVETLTDNHETPSGSIQKFQFSRFERTREAV